MSITDHSAITELAEGQANKAVTINEAFNALDRKRGRLELSAAGSGTLNLTADQARYGWLVLTGTLTGARTLVIPNDFSHEIIIQNSTAGSFALNVQYGSDSSVAVAKGSAVNVYRTSGGGAAFGVVATSILPELAVHRNGTHVSLPVATDTVVSFNNADVDTASGFNTGTGVYTAPAAGLYSVMAAVEIEVTAAGTGFTNAELAVRVNGSIVRYGDRQTAMNAAVGICRPSLSCLLWLSAGDTVDLVARQEQTGSTSRINHGSSRTYLLIRQERI